MSKRKAIATLNGSPSAALDCSADPQRRLARIAGIFFVVTFISIAALPLYNSVLKDTGFVAGSGGDARVYLGALAEILTLAAGIGTGVALYPALRRQSGGLRAGVRRRAHLRVHHDRGRHRQPARGGDAAPGPRRRLRHGHRVADLQRPL